MSRVCTPRCNSQVSLTSALLTCGPNEMSKLDKIGKVACLHVDKDMSHCQFPSALTFPWVLVTTVTTLWSHFWTCQLQEFSHVHVEASDFQSPKTWGGRLLFCYPLLKVQHKVSKFQIVGFFKTSRLGLWTLHPIWWHIWPTNTCQNIRPI